MMLLGALSALLIASLLAAAVCAWLLAGRAAWWSPPPPRHGMSAEAALRRHPAGRARQLDPAGLISPDADTSPALRRPAGPDDDPDFIRALERLIRGDNYDSS
jgi:hypothetical protein